MDTCILGYQVATALVLHQYEIGPVGVRVNAGLRLTGSCPAVL